MKKNEIAVLILFATIAAMATYFIVNSLIGSRTSQPVSVETVEKIDSDIQTPSNKIFNDRAINPAVPIFIGDDNNNAPFSD